MTYFLRLFLVATACAVAAPALAAAETRPPLAALTAPGPADIAALRDAELARALGAAGADAAFAWPGGDFRVTSLSALLDGWEEAGARDLWLRLDQRGGSLLDAEPSLGWRLPAGPALTPEQALSWLEENGGEWRGRARTGDDPAGGTAVRLGRGDRPDIPAPTGEGLALHLATRPLVGYAGLATGADLRALAARARLRIPPHIEGRVWAADGLVGVAAVLEDFLPSAEIARAGVVAATAGLTRDFASRVVVNPPLAAALLEVGDKLNPIGLSLGALLPRTLTLGWTDTPTGPEWQAVGIIGDDAFARKQFKRLWAWLDVAATVIPGLGVDRLEAAGRRLRRVSWRGLEAYVGVVEDPAAGADQAFLVISPDRDDFTGATPGVIAQARPYALIWDVRLSEAEHDAVFWHWRRELAGLGLLADEAALRRAVPAAETGGVWLDGATALLSTPRGLAALAAPLLLESFAELE